MKNIPFFLITILLTFDMFKDLCLFSQTYLCFLAFAIKAAVHQNASMRPRYVWKGTANHPFPYMRYFFSIVAKDTIQSKAHKYPAQPLENGFRTAIPFCVPGSVSLPVPPLSVRSAHGKASRKHTANRSYGRIR